MPDRRFVPVHSSRKMDVSILSGCVRRIENTRGGVRVEGWLWAVDSRGWW